MVIAEVLPQLEISAELDLKVNMSDIIGMIAEERREQLEAHSKVLKRERAVINRKLDAVLKRMQERALRDGRRACKRFEKLLDNPSDGKYKQVTMYGGCRWENDFKSAPALLQQMSRSKKWAAVCDRLLIPVPKARVRRYDSSHHDPIIEGVPYLVSFDTDNATHWDGNSSTVNISATWRLPDEWYRNADCKVFVGLVMDADTVYLGLDAVEIELKDLDKKSRRAKAKLVRELLQASPKGRKLLSSMGANKKLLLGAVAGA